LKPFATAKNRRFAPVPKASERPILGLRSNKNFIVTNAVENILRGKNYPPNNNI